MIIGVSGRIGSGKDTIGKIIQYLTYRDWMNPDGSKGKYAPYEMKYWLDESMRISENHPGATWKIKKFAYKLKQICSLLTGISVEDFEKQEVKDRLLGEGYKKSIRTKSYDELTKDQKDRAKIYLMQNQMQDRFNVAEDWIPSVRWLLQTIGTEAMRDKVHENVWINALFTDYESLSSSFGAFDMSKNPVEFIEIGKKVVLEHPNWIITDMRFPNEMKAIEDRSGITIRVNRNYVLTGANKDPSKLHASETALDNAKFKYTIDNNGSIEELVEKVKEILTKEKIL